MALFHRFVYFILGCIILSILSGCTYLSHEAGSSGYFDGEIRLLSDGGIGIEGLAYPAGVLFPDKEAAKYRLFDDSAAYLKNRYNVNNGDVLSFWFVLHKYSDVDWGTIVSIGTDLIISSSLK